MTGMPAFIATPSPPDLAGVLGELSPEPFSEHFQLCVELVERYAGDWALALAAELALAPALADALSANELAARRGFVPGFVPALQGLLRRLAADGVLAVAGQDGTGAPRYRAVGPWPSEHRAELRAQGLATDPGIAPSLELLDLAGGLYPPLARGEVRGEQVLLGAGHVGLWGEYFSNRHPVYAINNVIAAVAALTRAPAGRFAVLELGAGAGSATEELLARLEQAGRLGDLTRYEVTEPSTFFRRRAERALRSRFPGVPLSFSALDIDLPLDATATAAGEFDLVFAVNVLHVARDLPAALARLRERLAPGGWLVGGECIRLFPGQPIAAEMVFLALEGFVGVELDPERRPEPGFLTPEVWRRLFTGAGLAPVELVPDLERIRDLYPFFNSGAICGRRPL